MDVLIFGGQSNMQGQTEGLPSENEAVENALEYRVLSNTLIDLKHPVGENVSQDTHLLGAHGGGGSLVPACCKEYVKRTGRKVVAIHVARGNTTVGEWLKGTHRYRTLTWKCTAGIKKAAEIEPVERVYFIWLQGESDANISSTSEEYVARITALKNDLKKDVGIDKFGIIKVGYFCSNTPKSWSGASSDEEALAKDEAILQAQEMVVERDQDFVMLTRICPKISCEKEWINPTVPGHYNNAAMDLIGKSAGETLAKL